MMGQQQHLGSWGFGTALEWRAAHSLHSQWPGLPWIVPQGDPATHHCDGRVTSGGTSVNELGTLGGAKEAACHSAPSTFRLGCVVRSCLYKDRLRGGRPQAIDIGGAVSDRDRVRLLPPRRTLFIDRCSPASLSDSLAPIGPYGGFGMAHGKLILALCACWGPSPVLLGERAAVGSSILNCHPAPDQPEVTAITRLDGSRVSALDSPHWTLPVERPVLTWKEKVTSANHEAVSGRPPSLAGAMAGLGRSSPKSPVLGDITTAVLGKVGLPESRCQYRAPCRQVGCQSPLARRQLKASLSTVEG